MLTDDLEEFPVAEVEVAIRLYRQNSANRYFPTSGALRDIIHAQRRERSEMSRLKPKVTPLNRPLMWWHRPKSKWPETWLEWEVPPGQLICDEEGGSHREPSRRAA